MDSARSKTLACLTFVVKIDARPTEQGKLLVRACEICILLSDESIRVHVLGHSMIQVKTEQHPGVHQRRPSERIFGVTITNSDGKQVPVRYIGEQHVREDLGRIPTAQDWLSQIKPQRWMYGQRLAIERSRLPSDVK